MIQTDGEIYHVLGWKNQHCENDCTTESNLQIQCNPYQTNNGIFHRTRTKYLKICMETQTNEKIYCVPGSEESILSK